MADKDLAQLEKQEAAAGKTKGQEENRGNSTLIAVGVVIAILLIVVIGVVAGTAINDNANVDAPTRSPTLSPTVSPTLNPTKNPTVSPTFNPTENPTVSPTLNPTKNPTVSPTFNPTVSPTFNPTLSPTFNPTSNPTRSPFQLDFTTSEFIGACTILELSAFGASTFYESPIVDGLNSSVGVIFGFFTCIDQSLIACDIDQEEFFFEGVFCEAVDASFGCQCGQGVLNILTDGFFAGRNEVACASVVENAQCNPAGDDLEAELLNTLHEQFFYEYINEVEGDEFNVLYEVYDNIITFETVEDELQDFGFYARVEDDFLFDLIFECELGFDFSVCLNERTLFLCQDQSFVAELCFRQDFSFGCANPVGEIVPLEEGALECVLTDSPTPNPTTNPTSSPTRNPLQLDFTLSEFVGACTVLEVTAFAAVFLSDSPIVEGFDSGVGVIFGFYTCFDQSLLVCDIEQVESIFEGTFCGVVDPSFECQCGQGVLNILTDGFFDGRNEVGCAAALEEAQCNPAGDGLEAELLTSIHEELFYYYVNDIEGDEANVSDLLYERIIPFADIDNELQDFGFYARVEDDFVFDLIFDCESGLEFSVCLNEKTLFVCQNQSFILDVCRALSFSDGCVNPVGEIVPLDEGVLECVLTDSPTPSPIPL